MANQYLLMVSSNNQGFLVRALVDAVVRSGIEVKTAEINDIHLVNYIEDAFGVFVEGAYENTVKLGAIKAKCYELGRSVMLYGSTGELDVLHRVFVGSMIYKEFERPAPVEDVVSAVEKLQIRVQNQSIMKKILVVDDNGVYLRTMMQWLEGKYNVTLANSASRAMDAIQKQIPDLILLDYEMPICSGGQFMQILSGNKLTKEIPVIFLTARNDAQTVREVMELKPKGYILKTTPQDLLMQKIADFFDSLEYRLMEEPVQEEVAEGTPLEETAGETQSSGK